MRQLNLKKRTTKQLSDIVDRIQARYKVQYALGYKMTLTDTVGSLAYAIWNRQQLRDKQNAKKD